MATLAVKRSDLYPVGTKVKFFLLPTPRPGELRKNNTGSPANWKPALTEYGEATVDAAGVLKPTIGTGAGEIPTEVPYLCWAEVGGVDVYLEGRSAGTAKETA